LGRFISEDPGQGGENWYIYCASNPVTLLDPNGKDGIGIEEVLLGGILELLGCCAASAGNYGLFALLVIIGVAIQVYAFYSDYKELSEDVHDLGQALKLQGLKGAGKDYDSPSLLDMAGLSIAVYTVEIDIACDSVDD
jgi:hypothetical protein